MNKLILLVIFFALATCHLSERLIQKYAAEIIKQGDSDATPTKGSKVAVHYTGTLLSGKKFDSSKDRNQPFEFSVGSGQVIVCWDEVVGELSVGDQVIVTCPYHTAYGDRAVGPIPTKSDLKFHI
jgi:FKBP-type peptidyl-prolyl cis-trans isomerase